METQLILNDIESSIIMLINSPIQHILFRKSFIILSLQRYFSSTIVMVTAVSN